MQFKLTKQFVEELKSKIRNQDEKWIQTYVLELHHADIADVLDELTNSEAKYVYYLVDEVVQSDILMDLQPAEGEGADPDNFIQVEDGE